MKEIVNNLKNGKLVIIPTDTVYGISADACNEEAVQSVFEAKKRGAHPLIILVSSKDMLKKYTKNISPLEEDIIDKYYPNTLTMLLQKNDNVLDSVTCSSPYVGVRIPNNKLLLDIINELGRPIISTSANISGTPVITNPKNIEQELLKSIDYVYDDGEKTDVASTLIKVENNKIKILREGILANQIRNDFSSYIEKIEN